MSPASATLSRPISPAETIKFRAPVKVGDEVGVWAELIEVGRTPMRFKISAWRRAHDSDLPVKVTDAVFVLVALDGAGKPRAVAGEQ